MERFVVCQDGKPTMRRTTHEPRMGGGCACVCAKPCTGVARVCAVLCVVCTRTASRSLARTVPRARSTPPSTQVQSCNTGALQSGRVRAMPLNPATHLQVVGSVVLSAHIHVLRARVGVHRTCRLWVVFLVSVPHLHAPRNRMGVRRMCRRVGETEQNPTHVPYRTPHGRRRSSRPSTPSSVLTTC